MTVNDVRTRVGSFNGGNKSYIPERYNPGYESCGVLDAGVCNIPDAYDSLT